MAFVQLAAKQLHATHRDSRDLHRALHQLDKAVCGPTHRRLSHLQILERLVAHKQALQLLELSRKSPGQVIPCKIPGHMPSIDSDTSTQHMTNAKLSLVQLHKGIEGQPKHSSMPLRPVGFFAGKGIKHRGSECRILRKWGSPEGLGTAGRRASMQHSTAAVRNHQ